ncbi:MULTISPECIES: effector-associated constant component EACC1 [Streptosporangium]|uniref:Uncharacterized protein n=1 Tax=Streptosporangium brasiliense TaxID=47480 RepID=A0ABT9R7L7_9ACTN|nr:hypothetical protein [Streptosporangium brasiliense]MDP9864799.1 hypothetical protein [Streptosporangium brasiliense]
MTFNIRISGEHAEQELRSLYDWLLREPEILDHADVLLVTKEPSPGQMGDTLDLIALVIASGLQLPSLAAVLTSWRKTRRHKPQVTIERGGTTVALSEADPDLIIQILDAMKDHTIEPS